MCSTVRARPPGALLLGVALAWLGTPALAQQASMSLWPTATPWNEPVEARVEGVGCPGTVAPPVESVVGFRHVIDIDLLGCDAASTAPFATTVRVGPFYSGFSPYRIRVRNGPPRPGPDPPPPAVLAQADLEVFEAASTRFELPTPALAGVPLTIRTWLQAIGCGSVHEPRLDGQVIELFLSLQCPPIGIPPPGQAGLVSIPWEVGRLVPGLYDVRLIEFGDGGYPTFRLARTPLVVYDPERCVPSPNALCLAANRFLVEVTWTDFAGHLGVGHARPLGGDGASGLLWFFAPDNVELTAKLLDGCGVNGHWWFFLASGSTVEYTVTVTDTATGARRTYANASGESAPLLSDTRAFPCDGGT